MKLNILISSIFTLIISGCASFSGGPELLINPDDEVNILRKSFNAEKVGTYLSTPVKNSSERKNLRNEIVSSRLYAIDIRFFEYARALTNELRRSAFGIDVLSLILTGTATAITPSTTTTALSGIDTALKGSRKSFNKEILLERSMDIILEQMIANRKQIAAQMWQNLATLPDNKYPLSLALSQLEDYYQAGTMTGALINIRQNVSLISANAEKDFASKVLKVTYGENKYTNIFNNYINSASNEEEKVNRTKKIQDAINELGGTILAEFLIDSNDNKNESLQKQVIEKLKLD